MLGVLEKAQMIGAHERNGRPQFLGKGGLFSERRLRFVTKVVLHPPDSVILEMAW